jgi:MGT family glycosyltransferase
MKLIVMNIPGHGHVNPTLPIIEGLVARGHEVIYYNSEEFRAKISATGAEFRPYPTSGLSPSAMSQAVSKHLVDVTLLLFEQSLMLTNFMLGEIQRERPDLLIFDSICLWGYQAARLSGVPSISSITTFVLEGVNLNFSWRDRLHVYGSALSRLPKLIKARSALVQRYGRASLPQKHIFPCVGDLNLLYTIPALQPPTSFIDTTFRFVGPSLPLHNQEATLPLPEGRLIYISLGTIHTDTNFYAACFEAFADMSATFVLAAGNRAAELSPPPNFIVHSHVPQLEVLQRSSLFVTHAGINSLHESLYFGVPMVMVPQQMEQAMNARIAEMHGLGVILGGQPPYGKGVNAVMLREAVEKVLADEGYQAAAQRMKGLLQATNGTADAIEAILDFGAAGPHIDRDASGLLHALDGVQHDAVVSVGGYHTAGR